MLIIKNKFGINKSVSSLSACRAVACVLVDCVHFSYLSPLICLRFEGKLASTKHQISIFFGKFDGCWYYNLFLFKICCRRSAKNFETWIAKKMSTLYNYLTLWYYLTAYCRIPLLPMMEKPYWNQKYIRVEMKCSRNLLGLFRWESREKTAL